MLRLLLEWSDRNAGHALPFHSRYEQQKPLKVVLNRKHKPPFPTSYTCMHYFKRMIASCGIFSGVTMTIDSFEVSIIISLSLSFSLSIAISRYLSLSIHFFASKSNHIIECVRKGKVVCLKLFFQGNLMMNKRMQRGQPASPINNNPLWYHKWVVHICTVHPSCIGTPKR